MTKTAASQKRTRMWITFLVLVLVLAFLLYSGPALPPAADGISRLERVELGGVRQWISLRATNPNAPVLLFLHGGPGSANLAKIRLQIPELEQHFMVVNWDQRGAGKSSSIGFDYGTLSIEQMVSEAHELVSYLKARFGVEKIYLMGFSWGTVIGLELAARYPEDLYAYISVSQIVHSREGERLSLAYVQTKASLAGNLQAVSDLAGIDPAYEGADGFSQVTTERKWLLHYGGVYHTSSSYHHEIWMLLRSPEYSFLDVCLWPGRSSASLQQLWPQVMKVNFFDTIPVLSLPVYFLVGRHDQNAPAQLTEQYYQQLVDPAGKHLVWFENSAHDPFYDEPKQLTAELISILEAPP